MEKATHFIQTDWFEYRDLPIKKNICLNCAAKTTDAEFTSFLKILINKLQDIVTMIPKETKLDAAKTYYCQECLQATVTFNQHFEAYTYTKCDIIYKTFGLNYLQEVTD